MKKMTPKKKNILVGLVMLLVVGTSLAFTVYLAQQRQILKGRASTPTGTTYMCVTHTSQTADCQTAPASYTATLDPDNPNTSLQIKVKSGSTPIAGIAFKLILPAANINSPTITPNSSYDGSNPPADRWKVASFSGTPCTQPVCLVGSNYEIQYAVYYDRSDGSLPPTFNNNVIATVTVPGKNAGSTNITFDPSLSKLADVNSDDVLFTPTAFNLVLNADTTAPTVNFLTGPADNTTVSVNTAVTYTYSATDTITTAANLRYVAQFDNTTCPAATAPSWSTTTSFTTPTLTAGAHTTTACAKDSSGNIGKVTRTITYVIPDTTPPVVTFNSGPADNSTVFVNTPVTYTYSATDNVTPTANIGYVAQFDNTTCPAATGSWTTATSFTTPALTEGAHSVTVCAKDSSNNIGKATRNITYATTSILLRVKLAGIPFGTVTPPASFVASRVVVQDTVTPPAAHTFKRSLGSNICSITDDAGPVTFTFTNGAYQATIPGFILATGKTYEIIVKGPSHLATRVKTGLTFTTAQLGTTVTVDTTGTPIKGGDVAMPDPNNVNSNVNGQNCKLELVDLTFITGLFTSLQASTQGNANRDINKDGFITIEDVTLISNNFTALEVLDDQ